MNKKREKYICECEIEGKNFSFNIKINTDFNANEISLWLPYNNKLGLYSKDLFFILFTN